MGLLEMVTAAVRMAGEIHRLPESSVKKELISRLEERVSLPVFTLVLNGKVVPCESGLILEAYYMLLGRIKKGDRLCIVQDGEIVEVSDNMDKALEAYKEVYRG